MSWYRRTSGQPVYAVDGSSYAEVLIAAGSTVIANDQVTATIAAWATRSPSPVGEAPDFVTETELSAALAALATGPGGGSNASPDPADPAVLVVTPGGSLTVDPADPTVLIAA